MHDVLYAHRPSFLTLRLFEQVLEEVHRTALTSRLGMLCRQVAKIGNMSTARLFIAIFVSPFSSDLCMIVLADIAVIVVGY